MSLFLLTFFLLYGGLHYYLFSKFRYGLHPGALPLILVGIFLCLMIAAPLLVYTAGKHGWETSARLGAHGAYLWMGFAFLFFAGSLALDLYRLLAYGGVFFRKAGVPSPTPFLQFLLPLLFALSAATYGYFEALHIRTERITIRTPKLAREAGPLRVVQISDVHLGLIVREGRLSRILNEVKKSRPDLFISTGDLVDSQINHLRELTRLLQEIQPRHGKFAVTGNHEFYAGLPQALDFTRQAGFTLLRGQGITIGGLLNLAGVDDPAGGPGAGLGERELLSGLPRDRYTILLKHRPVIDPESLPFFDLQISGHTHRGQIFPFVILTRIFFPYYSGYFRLAGESLLYVSRGSGTWGPPIRFLAPPEVTVYDLVPAEAP